MKWAPMLLPTFLEISAEWPLFSATAHLPSRAAPRLGRAGVSGPANAGAHHLDQRRRAAQLERRVFFALAMPLAAATAVRAQDGAFDPTGVSSTRSALAAVSRQSDAGAAVCASVAVGSVASESSDQRPRPAGALRVRAGAETSGPAGGGRAAGTVQAVASAMPCLAAHGGDDRAVTRGARRRRRPLQNAGLGAGRRFL